MPTILTGQTTSVPIDGTSPAPSNPAWAWEVVDHYTNTSLDHSTVLGTAGANGWNVAYNSSTGQFDVSVPTNAPVGNGPNRFQYLVSSAIAS